MRKSALRLFMQPMSLQFRIAASQLISGLMNCRSWIGVPDPAGRVRLSIAQRGGSIAGSRSAGISGVAWKRSLPRP